VIQNYPLLELFTKLVSSVTDTWICSGKNFAHSGRLCRWG